MLNLLAGTVLAAVVFFLSDFILMVIDERLLWGSSLLRLSVVALPFICANQMLRLLAIAGGVKGILVASMGLSVIVSMVITAGLSLSYGARGALQGYVISEVLLFFVLAFLVRKKLPS
jgi:hypothetical protein